MAKGIKTGGRTKGTLNRTTAETKTLLQSIINNELDNIATLLEQLEPKERVDSIIKLLPYIVPKQQEITSDNKTNNIINLGSGIDPDSNTIKVEIIQAEQVKQILQELEEKY